MKTIATLVSIGLVGLVMLLPEPAQAARTCYATPGNTDKAIQCIKRHRFLYRGQHIKIVCKQTRHNQGQCKISGIDLYANYQDKGPKCRPSAPENCLHYVISDANGRTDGQVIQAGDVYPIEITLDSCSSRRVKDSCKGWIISEKTNPRGMILIK